MVSKDNVCVKCDPLNPGDPREGILRSRYLASFAAFRGNCNSSEVDEVLYNVQKDGSRFDKYSPDIGLILILLKLRHLALPLFYLANSFCLLLW